MGARVNGFDNIRDASDDDLTVCRSGLADRRRKGIEFNMAVGSESDVPVAILS